MKIHSSTNSGPHEHISRFKEREVKISEQESQIFSLITRAHALRLSFSNYELNALINRRLLTQLLRTISPVKYTYILLPITLCCNKHIPFTLKSAKDKNFEESLFLDR